LGNFELSPVLAGLWIATHEGVVDQLLASRDLIMNLSLIVVPNLPALGREDGFDAQEMAHGCRLKNPALKVGEGYPLAVNREARVELLGCEGSTHPQPLDVLSSSETEPVVIQLPGQGTNPTALSSRYPSPIQKPTADRLIA
jgi:hypothetical protein